MTINEPIVWRPGEATSLDVWLESVELLPAVFLIWAREGTPYLGRTSQLRRRLKRLLGERAGSSRLLHLRDVATRVEYWPTASRLESALVSYELARRHYPDEYSKILRLPKPPYVKLILSNRFPRTQLTTRLSGRSPHYGPFRNRAAAEEFEKALLDLFQIRRCQEDLVPSPDHPGCIYGEMSMCLRPCQGAVSDEEYASEAVRVQEFVATQGASLADTVRTSRDRLSGEMQFEEAARQHARLDKIEAVQRLSGDLARDAAQVCGVAVTRAAGFAPGQNAEAGAVRLWFLAGGAWREPVTLELGADPSGKPLSLDARLKESSQVVLDGAGVDVPSAQRQEHLAMLVRWFYSSWRDGEWVPCDNLDAIPWRKLVNAVRRVAQA